MAKSKGEEKPEEVVAEVPVPRQTQQEAFRDQFKDNPSLAWEAFSTTNPQFTKEVGYGNFKFTAIDAYYQFENMTKLFGPMGMGWGFEIVDEGAYGDEGDHQYVRMHIRVWHSWDRDVYIDVFGTADMKKSKKVGSGQNQRTIRIEDSECWKKALTDALTKGLSYLGMSADVFMGKFDDNKYVAEQWRKQREDDNRKEAERKEAERQQQENDAAEMAEDAARQEIDDAQAPPSLAPGPDPDPEPAPAAKEPEAKQSVFCRLSPQTIPDNMEEMNLSALVKLANDVAMDINGPGHEKPASEYLKVVNDWKTFGDLKSQEPYLRNFIKKLYDYKKKMALMVAQALINGYGEDWVPRFQSFLQEEDASPAKLVFCVPMSKLDEMLAELKDGKNPVPREPGEEG